MEIVELKIKIKSPFGNLFRKRLVLIAVVDQQGNILVGSKPNYYPEGIYRFIGGGVDEGEEPVMGGSRELQEELGVVAQTDELKPLLQVNVHAVDDNGRIYENSNYIYLYKLKNNNYKAGDDIKGVVKLSIEELVKLGEKYESLSEDDWFRNETENYNWKDYGKVYGPIHKLVAEKLKVIILP